MISRSNTHALHHYIKIFDWPSLIQKAKGTHMPSDQSMIFHPILPPKNIMGKVSNLYSDMETSITAAEKKTFNVILAKIIFSSSS